jgi:hypothetical protein
MTYRAAPVAIADLSIGDEILYFAGGEYVPGTTYHGIVTALFSVLGSPQAQFRAVRIDSMTLPIRLYASRPLFKVNP